MKKTSKWVLILGGSSGLGLATARKLSKHGFNILIVHRDRRSELDAITGNFQEIISSGAMLHNFNIDATNPIKRDEAIKKIKKLLGPEKINVFVHSIAKGNLKPMVDENEKVLVNQDFHLTIDAMAVSLYDWVKSLIDESLFAKDSRIIAFTSEGNTKAWKNYGAVSAAKAALEAIMRNIALEFAYKGVKANCIQAGVTDTKSLNMIPNSDNLKSESLKRNPNKRLTKPEDIANATYLLTMDEAKWITGTIIKVDGGESLQ
ncbi:Enoyl-[acyl-carrier-protein] reductase (NADH) [Flagellimonas maritima]|uniref:Enoyl-[acyl-carrier-protein] reductase (NADH) n=1 Tax=Flagellimonas maritima TaxID=1383885 RepID=A0A2Z4LWN1_9FLAO|nr:SDR family oxidoreductase [Allomuricauda aurantiaca]AWX46159.1 Enoyl-[acyl-carrier-protein] reductase (NADH) [Allomuricauda aurantiaca]